VLSLDMGSPLLTIEKLSVSSNVPPRSFFAFSKKRILFDPEKVKDNSSISVI